MPECVHESSNLSNLAMHDGPGCATGRQIRAYVLYSIPRDLLVQTQGMSCDWVYRGTAFGMPSVSISAANGGDGGDGEGVLKAAGYVVSAPSNLPQGIDLNC